MHIIPEDKKHQNQLLLATACMHAWDPKSSAFIYGHETDFKMGKNGFPLGFWPLKPKIGDLCFILPLFR